MADDGVESIVGEHLPVTIFRLLLTLIIFLNDEILSLSAQNVSAEKIILVQKALYQREV